MENLSVSGLGLGWIIGTDDQINVRIAIVLALYLPAKKPNLINLVLSDKGFYCSSLQCFSGLIKLHEISRNPRLMMIPLLDEIDAPYNSADADDQSLII